MIKDKDILQSIEKTDSLFSLLLTFVKHNEQHVESIVHRDIEIILGLGSEHVRETESLFSEMRSAQK